MRLLFPESDVVAYQSVLPHFVVVNRFIWYHRYISECRDELKQV
jgi:hypothetical protein